MKKNINLNSQEWCDIVFEKKNKEYGAYQLRQSSSNRHLLALGVTIMSLGLLIFSTTLVGKVIPPDDYIENYSGIVSLTEIPIDVPEEPEKFLDPMVPPPPPLVSSIKYTPPIIVDESEFTDDEQMLSQTELNNTNVLISIANITTDNTEGADIADVLREQHIITGEPKEPEIWEHVDVMPQFPGGNSELMKYLSRNLVYPNSAAEIGIQGKVIIKFVVNKKGEIENVTIVKGIDPSCDKEAVRVVKSMPKWIPGSQNGVPVNVYFNLPISFQLRKQ